MQFTVYLNANKASGGDVPYLLDVQNDLIASFKSRVVVPLVSPSKVQFAVSRLMPIFEIEGASWVMDTTLMAGISSKLIGKKVADLSHERSRIIAALDVLISGI